MRRPKKSKRIEQVGDAYQRWRKLKPEERVDVAVGMTDVAVNISAENERRRNPRISEEGLILRIRERLQPKREARKAY